MAVVDRPVSCDCGLLCSMPDGNNFWENMKVNVTMPAFVFDTEDYLSGIIVANYTSGAPVRGNLTITATMKPIDYYRRGQLPTSYRAAIFEQKLQQIVHDVSGLIDSILKIYKKFNVVSVFPNL